MRKLFLASYTATVDEKNIDGYHLVAATVMDGWDEEKELKWASIVFKEWWSRNRGSELTRVVIVPTAVETLEEEAEKPVFLSIHMAARMLNKFWNSSSDACPLEATEQERQEKEFSDYVHSKAWMIEEGVANESVKVSHPRPLQAPAKHTLQECLAELKFGRPAAQQLFLQEIIDELNKGQEE